MKDVGEYCRQCDLCQPMGQPNGKDRMPHQPVLPLEPFQKWGLHFVGPFKTRSRIDRESVHHRRHRLCTKWVKAKALRDNTTTSTTKYL